MSTFIMVVLGILFLVFGLPFISNFADWYFSRDSSCPRISYKNFKNFYAIAPKKWNLKKDKYLYYDGHLVEFNNYTDVMKYQRFRKQIEKHAEEMEKNTRQAAFLEEIQKDIDRYRDQAAEETAAALERIQDRKAS